VSPEGKDKIEQPTHPQPHNDGHYGRRCRSARCLEFAAAPFRSYLPGNPEVLIYAKHPAAFATLPVGCCGAKGIGFLDP
jgi:hypothetical protein